MSRSKLIQILQRTYQSAQVVTPSHLATDHLMLEAEALWHEKVSRRRVLQAGVALAGLLGLPSQAVGAELQTGSSVLIVGAGIAGLTAAYRLRQAGVPIDLIEATRRVGGRLVSCNPRNPQTGATGVVELGGEFIDTRHTFVRSLATELGLQLADLKAADVGLEPEVLYFQGQKVSHRAIIEAFVPLAERITQDLRQLGEAPISYHAPSPHAMRLDMLSLADYLAETPLDPIIRELVRVAYVTEYGLDAEEQSCLNLLLLIGTEMGQWSTYGISDERWHVVGGNEQIPQRLAQGIENAIALDTILESIRLSADGRYRVSLRRGLSSVERIYERILLTVPFSVLRQVELAVDLPPVKQRAIAELGYGTSTKLATPYQERIWRTRYDSTISIYTDMDFQNTWESARYQEGPAAWLTDLRAGQQGLRLGADDAEIHAQALAQDLEDVFPGISQVQRGRSVRAFWAAEPFALGSYSCYKPGQWTQLAGAEGERVGNLWFAGEHCTIETQGYMDGAIETAEQAAMEILEDLGLKASAAQQRSRLHQNRQLAEGAIAI
jgi:monoamine oxidase